MHMRSPALLHATWRWLQTPAADSKPCGTVSLGRCCNVLDGTPGNVKLSAGILTFSGAMQDIAQGAQESLCCYTWCPADPALNSGAQHPPVPC